jgi:hypothetical protein
VTIAHALKMSIFIVFISLMGLDTKKVFFQLYVSVQSVILPVCPHKISSRKSHSLILRTSFFFVPSMEYLLLNFLKAKKQTQIQRALCIHFPYPLRIPFIRKS